MSSGYTGEPLKASNYNNCRVFILLTTKQNIYEKFTLTPQEAYSKAFDYIKNNKLI